MSKLACESLCEFYAAQCNVNIRVLRPFSVYGAGQSDAFLLSEIMRQIISPSPVIEVSDLAPKRDYIYIDDLISAMLLSQKPWHGLETFNIGTGVSFSVKEALEIMLRECECSKTYRLTNESRINETDNRRADISKAREILQFEPKFSFQRGVTKWYEEIGGIK
jgi:nucleoside-diphosphate-sugar epimerase